jgi:biopolymer transport protein ExbD
MKFYPRRRRAAPTIIIISLIDVLIVLVVFLLAATTYKNQPSVKLTLPETGDTPKAGATDEKPLIVSVAKDEPHYYVGNRAVTPEKLQTELKVAASADPNMRLVIRADGGAEWRLVVKVMEFAKLAPIKNVKAFTKGAAQTGQK